VETTPGRPRKGLLKATQYFDPGEGRPVGTRVEPPLRTGDFVTVLPYTINYEWLYCLIIGPSNNYKLSKLYTVEALRGGSVPLKFTAKSSKEGTFQVLLVATREELPDIQLYIQKANLAAVSKGKEKEERTKGLLDILTANLPEGEWGHLTLDPIPFKP
jgi:hypothetical protein